MLINKFTTSSLGAASLRVLAENGCAQPPQVHFNMFLGSQTFHHPLHFLLDVPVSLVI